GKAFPVEIVVKDSASNPARAADVAADLILKDKVDLILVSSTPETTNPVADQCELERKPCISTVAPWQPWFFGRGAKPDKGFDWTYHFF
ncbi:ABC transporter substrate-binding protein, partial [Acinetobacter baumannii]